MSFSPDSILERTRKNNKGKKGIGLFNEPDYANCRAITETFRLVYIWSDVEQY
jgi:hypothetical protein